MGRLAGRIGAIIFAGLFLLTSLGFSLLVIWQQHQQDRQMSQATATQQQQQQNSCAQASSTSGGVLKVPAVYKPSGSISSLQAIDISKGSGQTAKSGDCLQVKYLGSLAKDDTVFDENYDKPDLLKFQLGAGAVIPGWDQGLVGMKVGGERRLLIPSSLAYGSQGGGTSIPPNSDLVFDVLLVKIGQ